MVRRERWEMEKVHDKDIRPDVYRLQGIAAAYRDNPMAFGKAKAAADALDDALALIEALRASAGVEREAIDRLHDELAEARAERASATLAAHALLHGVGAAIDALTRATEVAA